MELESHNQCSHLPTPTSDFNLLRALQANNFQILFTLYVPIIILTYCEETNLQYF